MKFYSLYGERPNVQPTKTGPSKTKQSFKDECDINQIMKRYELTGMLPQMIEAEPRYGDFTDVPTYQEAQNIFLHAKEQFSLLSAKTRDRFNNDPAKFLEFVHNPENIDEMIKLGLAEAKLPPSPDIVETPKTSPEA